MEINHCEFLKELEALSKKYGTKICGCGCCGSPSLEDMQGEEYAEEAGYVYKDHLQYISKQDEYDWKKYSGNIVK